LAITVSWSGEPSKYGIKDTYVVCKYVKKTVFGVGFITCSRSGEPGIYGIYGMAYKRHICCMQICEYVKKTVLELGFMGFIWVWVLTYLGPL
jgi:hypothetical protein